MSKLPLLWDNHVYLPEFPGTRAIEQLERHRRAGFSVVMLNLGDADCSFEFVLRMAAFARAWLRARPDHYLLIETVDDIETARREGKLAVGFNVEGLYSIGDQLDALALYRDIGVRWALFVYNRENRLGSGVHDLEDKGLSAFGRNVAAEMDRLGIIKCLSHTGHRTARDILDASERPCIFSHSNASALWPHARNIPDDLILACADTGGVIGINGIATFLGDGPASPAAMADHIDHVVQLVGPTHVAIGTDFGYSFPGELVPEGAGAPLANDFWPEGNGYGAVTTHSVVEPEEIPDLYRILEERGYSSTDLAAIMGGNLLRVARAVWPLSR